MLYEVRDYHYRPDIWDDYRKWATGEAIPFLKANMDVLEFWLDSGIEPEISGTKPVRSDIGSANVTWVIRWPDKDTRDREFAKVMGSEGWRDIWSRHPDPGGYRQVSVRYMEKA